MTVFRDVDDTPAGEKWLDHIKTELAQADLFLLLIGPGWVQRIGQLQDPEDVLRQEIELALDSTDIRILPIVIDGGELPEKNSLPRSIQPILEAQAVRLPDDLFKHVVKARILPALGVQERMWKKWVLGAGAFAVCLAAFGVFQFYFKQSAPTSGTQQGATDLQQVTTHAARSCDPRITGLPGSLPGFNDIGLFDTFTSVAQRGSDMRIGLSLRDTVDLSRLSCLQFLFCTPENPNFCKTIETEYRLIKGLNNIYTFRVGDNWPVGQARVHMKLVQVSDPVDLNTPQDEPLNLADYKLYGEARDFEVK